MGAINIQFAAQPPFDPLLARIRSEFSEMPGLRLTFAQARRLWQLDPETCGRLLQSLVEEGFLGRTSDGAFIAESPFVHPRSLAPQPGETRHLGSLILRPARDRRQQPFPARTR